MELKLMGVTYVEGYCRLQFGTDATEGYLVLRMTPEEASNYLVGKVYRVTPTPVDAGLDFSKLRPIQDTQAKDAQAQWATQRGQQLEAWARMEQLPAEFAPMQRGRFQD